MVNLKAIKSEEDLTVFADDFLYDTARIPAWMRDGYLLAREVILDKYVFPNATCPWRPEYRIEQHHMSNSNISASVFLNRSIWLFEHASYLLENRILDAQTNNITPWGLIKTMILVGTYESMSASSQTLLQSQQELLSKSWGVAPSLPNNSAKTLQTLLQQNSYNWITKEGDPKASVGWTEPEFKTTIKRYYYLRVHARSEFSARCIYQQAQKIANDIFNFGEEKSQRYIDKWIDDLDHGFEIIDYFLLKKKREKAKLL